MAWKFHKETRPKARKVYPCDAWIIVNGSDLRESDVAPEDWPLIEKALKEKLTIPKGMIYIHVRGQLDGEWMVFRARPDMEAICLKYELYETD